MADHGNLVTSGSPRSTVPISRTVKRVQDTCVLLCVELYSASCPLLAAPAAVTAIAAVPLDTLTKPAAGWQPHAASQPQTWHVTLPVQHPAVHFTAQLKGVGAAVLHLPLAAKQARPQEPAQSNEDNSSNSCSSSIARSVQQTEGCCVSRDVYHG